MSYTVTIKFDDEIEEKLTTLAESSRRSRPKMLEYLVVSAFEQFMLTKEYDGENENHAGDSTNLPSEGMAGGSGKSQD